jgi:hypothetical protein
MVTSKPDFLTRSLTLQVTLRVLKTPLEQMIDNPEG